MGRVHLKSNRDLLPASRHANRDDHNHRRPQRHHIHRSIIDRSTPGAAVTGVCPQGNNTIMTPNLGMWRYRVLCDRDFNGGKEDLVLMVVPSFGDCMNLYNSMNYLQQRTDVGCTYNVAGTGTQTPGTCWCLGGETKTIVVNKGNQVLCRWCDVDLGIKRIWRQEL